jgi:hypothetical protein
VISAKIEVVKTLTCDDCGWECDCECCPMRGGKELTNQYIREQHPEFLWISENGGLACFCNDCGEKRQCEECGATELHEMNWCDQHEDWYCDSCWDKRHTSCEEEDDGF